MYITKVTKTIIKNRKCKIKVLFKKILRWMYRVLQTKRIISNQAERKNEFRIQIYALVITM